MFINFKYSKIMTRTLKALLMLFLWLFVLGSIVFLSYFIYLQRTIPDPETIITRKVGESTKIYDSTGEILLYDIHGEEKRTIVPWEDISDYAKKATLASEDNSFYEHKGIDFKGILRAALRNIQKVGIAEGGSTITQQLVGNALVGRQVTIGRKIQELILAIEVERRFTKDEIFWMYLNQIPYGSSAYGIEAASKTFFDKPAKELNLEEAAVLSILPRATTYYSPFGNNVAKLMERKDWLLARMLAFNFITQEEYNKAISAEIKFKANTESIAAPHFVIMVKEYLVAKYGEGAVENNGLKVVTTLDADLQSLAEETVSKYSKINKEKYKANNAALVSINPKSGEIKALVGSSDYFDVENEGNFNVATAKRQPGSAFKPFAYATAFSKGYPDSTVVFDTKTEFNPECSPAATDTKDKYGLDCYSPDNYDGRFRGPVTLRSALAQSLNVPSVKTLYLAGIEDTINLAENMGITTLQDRNRFGLSLVLGGAEVRLVDIVSAYGVFSNEGIRNPWFFIQRVEDSNGEILEEHRLEPKKVIDSQVARLINDVLSDNNARAPVFGYSNYLFVPGRELAAKTGTTQENRDAWVVGYSPSLVTGVWTGNNDNKSMTKEGAGISASGPMWKEFMVKALEGNPVESFTKPDLNISEKIMLNGRYSDNMNNDIHSILYYIDKDNPLGSTPINPLDDPQFKNWEWSVRNFFGLPYQYFTEDNPVIF